MSEQWSTTFWQLVKNTGDRVVADGSYNTSRRSRDAESWLGDETQLFLGLDDEGGRAMTVKDFDGYEQTFTKMGHVNLHDSVGVRNHFLAYDGRVWGNHIPFEGAPRRFFLSKNMLQTLLEEITIGK